ncbi:MAG TPA: carboxypeptidase regulatory-like domain-containing protein [Vicinamibacterales bacterium]|nr:carboxypeptidase regulatory-like domain-containing protein [Vicinamibacterales bacterium]
MTARHLPAAALLATMTACGGGTSAPSAPAPAVKYVLSGIVYNQIQGTQAAIVGARVDVTSGANAGRTTTSDATGRYRLDSLDGGGMTLRISAAGFTTATHTLTLGLDQSLDLGLLPDGAALTNGRVVDAVSQAGLGGVTISGASMSSAVSDSAGAFTVASTVGTGDPLAAVFAGSGVVERHTGLRVPGRDATVSLISGGFDLRAFDEMFRVSMLLRWTTAPPLLVETRTAQFTTVGAPIVTTVADEMSDSEFSALVDDLTWALPQMTGNTFSQFSSVTRRSSSPGASVSVLNSGVITVVREVGLTAGSGYWGYSRWQFQSDGTITGGMVSLDRDFERSGSPYRRSLRSHELGHALGYNHVTVRPSVMNASAVLEPTPWDRDASSIAFQRAPGNRSPDTDPMGYSPNRLGLPAMWSPPIR